MRRTPLAALALASCSLLAPRAVPQDREDAAEGEAIRAATTDARYLTPLVGTLPDDARVPSPRDFLGYTIGTPGKLTSATRIHDYYRELARTSPRVRVFPLGATDEGREMIAAAIAEPALLEDLEANARRIADLGDPRKTDAAAAEKLLSSSRPVYWVTAGLHSTELGPPEVLTELAYRLAVSETEAIRKVRSTIVTILTPVLETDGRERQVDWYRRHVAGYTVFDDMPPKSPPYWGHYTYHDNNRDAIMLSQVLTRNYLGAFLKFRPLVSLDLHESVPLLYVSTGTGPYNTAVDPITIAEWQWMSANEVTRLQALGLPGVWTWGFYDGWSPSYLLWVTNTRNCCGRFYETFGNGTAETVDRRLDDAMFAGKKVTSRQWYRSEPPPKKLKWSMRDNVNYMQSGVITSLEFVATHAGEFLRNHRKKAENAVRLGREKAPHAFAIPAEQKDLGATYDLVNLLARQSLEVHKLRTPFGEGKDALKAGDFVVRLDQPWRTLALTHLEVQKFPKDAELPPYDDVAWTLGLMMGVEVRPIADKGILKVGMDVVEGQLGWNSAWGASSLPAGIAIPDRGQRRLGPFRFALGATRVLAAERPFDVSGRSCPSGSLVIPFENAEAAKSIQPGDLSFVLLDRLPDVPTHEVDLPRVAVFTTWNNTQDTGWLRYALDTFKVPYTLIEKGRVRAGGMRKDFDVVVIASQGSSPDLAGIVNEIPAKWGPLAFTKTAEFPSHGVPIASDDVTGGMGFPGLENLRLFIEEGGVLVCLGSAGVLPVEGGLVRGVSVQRPQKPFPGSIVRAKVRRPGHPLAYGFDETCTLFRANLPIYSVRRHDERYVVIQFGTKPLEEDEDDASAPAADGAEKPKPQPLVIAGGYPQPDDLEKKPAVLDIPVGKGRVVIIAPAVTRRFQDHAQFRLLWNALLHWNDLPAPDPADEKKR